MATHLQHDVSLMNGDGVTAGTLGLVCLNGLHGSCVIGSKELLQIRTRRALPRYAKYFAPRNEFTNDGAGRLHFLNGVIRVLRYANAGAEVLGIVGYRAGR